MRRAVVRAVAGGLLLGLTGCGAGGSSDGSGDQAFVEGSGAVTTLPIGDRRSDAVDLRGTLLDGAEFDLGAHRGKVVLINVWGSWCAPCREEAPHLQQAWDELKDRDVMFVGLNTRDADDAARAFERRFGVTYPSVRDPDGRLQLVFHKTLPPTAIPSTILIDKDGRVAASVIGNTTKSTFTGLVEDLLAEG
jgi:thiol-disulfide isomerase/thioredoxin